MTVNKKFKYCSVVVSCNVLGSFNCLHIIIVCDCCEVIWDSTPKNYPNYTGLQMEKDSLKLLDCFKYFKEDHETNNASTLKFPIPANAKEAG